MQEHCYTFYLKFHRFLFSKDIWGLQMLSNQPLCQITSLWVCLMEILAANWAACNLWPEAFVTDDVVLLTGVHFDSGLGGVRKWNADYAFQILEYPVTRFSEEEEKWLIKYTVQMDMIRLICKPFLVQYNHKFKNAM